MDMNNTPEPRMPLVENLEFLDLMGVISSPCTIITGPIKAAGASARPQYTPSLTHSLWQRRNSWQPDRTRQFATLSQPAPPVRSSPSYYKSRQSGAGAIRQPSHPRPNAGAMPAISEYTRPTDRPAPPR